MLTITVSRCAQCFINGFPICDSMELWISTCSHCQGISVKQANQMAMKAKIMSYLMYTL